MNAIDRRRLLMLMAGTAASVTALDAALGQQQRPLRPAFRSIEPTEELMHQHGVLRRCLRVMDLGANSLASGRPLPRPILGAAELYLHFGTEHHERKLEEGYVFPDLRRVEPAGATDFERLTQTLVTQHRRGEEILQFLVHTAGRGVLAERDIGPLVRALHALRDMYAYHTAIEESLVFPTWKASIDRNRYPIVQEAFAQIGVQQYGRDGLAGAAKQISAIEAALGIGDLAAVTAPAPPHTSGRSTR